MNQTATTLRPSSVTALKRLPKEALLSDLERDLRVGDLVFIRIPWTPFRQIAAATGAWTNHVGIVSDIDRSNVLIAESRFPMSCRTSFARFVHRSEYGRVAVLRRSRAWSDPQVWRLQQAIAGRLGRLYDTGFNLRSRRQFCSRFVYEVLQEATGEELGQVTTFKDLLVDNAEIDLRLWKVWYFGRIPWTRTTVTPASLYLSSALQVVFDGEVWNDGINGPAY